MSDEDETLWHKCSGFPPRKTIDGKWSLFPGQLWRRKRNGKWEYKQDQETYDEWFDRQ